MECEEEERAEAERVRQEQEEAAWARLEEQTAEAARSEAAEGQHAERASLISDEPRNRSSCGVAAALARQEMVQVEIMELADLVL